MGAGAAFQAPALIVRNELDGVPDKIGVYDNTIALDQGFFKELGPALLACAQGRAKHELLFKFKLETATKDLNRVAKYLGLGEHLSFYQARHGGAAHDLVNKLRPRGSVRARGRWETESSLKRYTKTGKVQEVLATLRPDVRVYCDRSLQLLDRVLAGWRAPLSPPRA